MEHLTKDNFEELKPRITAALATVIEKTLREMGDDIGGLSWFSSKASHHPKNVA